MDIHGYNMYQFNQSDELVKQLYAQQALSSLPCQRPIPEPHAMPSPSGAPWNVQGMPWGSTAPTSLVQFTAQPSTSGLHLPPTIHCKRKSLDPEPAIPAKQLITEEKMAAHLNGLHISSDYTNYSSTSSFQTDEMMEDVPAPVMLNDKLKINKIVIADEIKKLQEEPLIPPSLLERLEKPCMSLVVWKPKEDILDINSKTENNNNSDDNEEMNERPKRRNGLLVAEGLGTMDVEM